MSERADEHRVDAGTVMDAERRANEHSNREVNGWQIYQSTAEGRWGSGQYVPIWHFWAVHWDLAEALIVAPTLDELITAVRDRQKAMHEEQLRRRSRLAVAGRLGWPDGTADTCEALEATNPPWALWWRPDHGYTARLEVPFHQTSHASKDPQELERLISQVPVEHDYSTSGCAWCWAQMSSRDARAGA